MPNTASLPSRDRPHHHRPITDVLEEFGTNPNAGLSSNEAKTRLRQYGRNELIVEKAEPAWRKFLAQFTDILVVLLLVATAISTVLWFYERETSLPYEAMAIFGIVLFNAVLGFVQESRAEAAVAALRAMSAAEANVMRDGRRQKVPAADVVPGDLILIEEGDTIPADARLIQSVALHTAEATLTGESLPVSKETAPVAGDAGVGDRVSMAFSGTSATYGRGTAVVTATGMRTEMGRIAKMLKDTESEVTPLQEELDRVGRILGAVVIVIALLMIGTILIVEEIHQFSEFFDVLILGVALAVAAVPEGLPAVVTAVLAMGVQRMARRKAIVRHLAAVETLGSTDVIASDKTGTLTRNEMTVRAVATASGQTTFEGHGYQPEEGVNLEADGGTSDTVRLELEWALTAADRASNAVLQGENGRWTVQGDPTEGALLVAARKAGLDATALNARLRRVGEVPFSSERKMMSTVHCDANRRERLIVFTKGAPDVLLTRCTQESVGNRPQPLTSERRAAILEANERLADQALRTLGVAARELPADAVADGRYGEQVEQDLVFLGLVGMIDPPREEAREAVVRARNAGIRPIMITGDHPRTASVIAAELGISSDGRVMTGAELQQQTDEQLAQTVQDVSVYARVNPEHKSRIVDALQSRGATVAMTGDGVNDAPALKSADIGVAMGITGTDVSKEAADIVLTDDNFATIVAAVEEGRAIFENIRKFLRYLLSSNVGEVLTMFLGVLFAGVIGLDGGGDAVVLPLLATQILWINLVTDGPPALALGLDPAGPGLMNRPPRPQREGVITRRMWVGILIVGAIMAVGTLLVLDASLPGGLVEGSGTLRYGQTMTFTTLMLFQLFNVLNSRSDEESAFLGLFRNGWLWGALGLSLALQVIVVYAPFLQEAFATVALSFGDWLFCVTTASSVLWLREASKLISRMRRRRPAHPLMPTG